MANETMIAAYAGGASGARAAANAGSTIVVVDAFRASATIAVLISKGARVIPVASIAEAASAPADFRAGERGSAKVAGFDFGNSPTEILAAEIPPGSTVALSTTNGTRVVEAAARAPCILAGSFVNATALADVLSTGFAGERVTVVGCGWEGRRASEDEAAAGAILRRLEEWGTRLDGRARRVVDAYLSRPAERLRSNSAALRLRRLGYERDLDLCLGEDSVTVVPVLRDGAFVEGRKEAASMCEISSLWAGSKSRNSS
ncbi:MAG: 2-phosphosulfolactate phosphatase [Rubrobacteraceae bacterium]